MHGWLVTLKTAFVILWMSTREQCSVAFVLTGGLVLCQNHWQGGCGDLQRGGSTLIGTSLHVRHWSLVKTLIPVIYADF